ncbi:hypothetical protein J5N97_006941 [Dioscorea zingiberensis]|uniref:Uncharacterized protein n=1 Tax=Dioscorea zingiberensis TaxID=325984 RepID=A0A9D5DD33_9LILI|nr:hypothetical protein J5N97_006941 [Dioscorea zingiberensis]
MSRVRILNVFQIPLPTPPPRDAITLSFLDTLWIGLPPVQLLLFYSDATVPFSSILESLKSSLSRTLPLFYPFAGKLTHIPSTGAISIDCSKDTTGAGVTFIEAEADGEIHRLGGGGEQDLLPVLDGRELPAPVLAVQVTRLEGKGLALGLAAHHAVVDGKAVWKFLEAWAASCRRGGDAPLACSVAAHDREVIRHRRGDEIARRFVQQLAPALPIVRNLHISP